MKVAIIGGGIAGLANAISLRRSGIECQVYERSEKNKREGLGFILMPNGVLALEKLGLKEEVAKISHPLNEAIVLNRGGKTLKQVPMQSTFGVNREHFIAMCSEHISEKLITRGMQFSHFEKDDNGHAQRAVFENGAKVEADIFVGCDGVRSKVRKDLFPEWETTSVRVKELVSIVKAPQIADQLGHRFLKVMDEKGGLASGCLQTGQGDVIWYIQYDTQKWDMQGPDEKMKKSFALDLVGSWPQPFCDLVELTDFTHSHVWFTTDLDPLPHFYKKNIVLLGDAAHAFLPFTSQGVNSALEDAIELSSRLAKNHSNLEEVFADYTLCRKEKMAQYLQSGRQLREHFLNPQNFESAPLIPLAK